MVSNGKIRINFAGRAIVLHVISMRGGDLRSFSLSLKYGFAQTFSLIKANHLCQNRPMDSIDRFIMFADEGIRVKYIHYADRGLNLHIN